MSRFHANRRYSNVSSQKLSDVAEIKLYRGSLTPERESVIQMFLAWEQEQKTKAYVEDIRHNGIKPE